jgi:hypothetical protein
MVEGFSGIIVDTYTKFFCAHEAVNGNLLENDGSEAGLMLTNELKFVKYIINFFDETFDLPIITDLKGFFLGGFNAMNESQFFSSIVTIVFLYGATVAD